MPTLKYQPPGRDSVAALAGRRIDAEGSPDVRFPVDAVPRVREELRLCFAAERVQMLVSSAACGADLLALDIAGRERIRRRIILPFPPERFRETSVIDRPDGEGADWEKMFDRAVAEVGARGDLIVLGEQGDETAAYAAANRTIVEEARRLAESNQSVRMRCVAIVVWEGAPHGPSDITEDFRRLAVTAGFKERPMLTK